MRKTTLHEAKPIEKKEELIQQLYDCNDEIARRREEKDSLLNRLREIIDIYIAYDMRGDTGYFIEQILRVIQKYDEEYIVEEEGENIE